MRNFRFTAFSRWAKPNKTFTGQSLVSRNNALKWVDTNNTSLSQIVKRQYSQGGEPGAHPLRYFYPILRAHEIQYIEDTNKIRKVTNDCVNNYSDDKREANFIPQLKYMLKYDDNDWHVIVLSELVDSVFMHGYNSHVGRQPIRERQTLLDDFLNLIDTVHPEAAQDCFRGVLATIDPYKSKSIILPHTALLNSLWCKGGAPTFDTLAKAFHKLKGRLNEHTLLHYIRAFVDNTPHGLDTLTSLELNLAGHTPTSVETLLNFGVPFFKLLADNTPETMAKLLNNGLRLPYVNPETPYELPSTTLLNYEKEIIDLNPKLAEKFKELIQICLKRESSGTSSTSENNDRAPKYELHS